MTEPAPEERPRTWLPLVIAGSLALLIVVGAIATHVLRTDLTPEKRAAADACEAEYEAQFPDGPGIVGGDIYAATQWQEVDDTMVRLGYLTEEEAAVTGEVADARDHEAESLAAAGTQTMTVVWQRDDESHAQCVAQMQDGSVTSTTITELVEPANTAEASASPSA